MTAGNLKHLLAMVVYMAAVIGIGIFFFAKGRTGRGILFSGRPLAGIRGFGGLQR